MEAHRIADDLGGPEGGWLADADAEVLAGLEGRLEAEWKMDEADAARAAGG